MEKRISKTYANFCSIEIFEYALNNNTITKDLINSEENIYGEIIANIVKRMEIILETPEHVLVKQDEPITAENDMLYFIAKGRC